MKLFVNVTSVFPEFERDLDSLKTIYSDKEKLLSLIESVVGAQLTKEVIKGQKLLLKPNWVTHPKVPDDEWCLRTHDNFLLATLDYLLRLEPREVVIGDAPIQGCHWNKMIRKELIAAIQELADKHKTNVVIKDFRRTYFDPASSNVVEQKSSISKYVIFDVGKNSYLEPITKSGPSRFRVTVYNPDRFDESHRPGVHKYCITNELFDADVVISLPKAKTHQKTGITAALKNIVGLNGDKDFLPHHRIGGTDLGGDCYPGGNRLRYLSELSLDNANRNKGNWKYPVWIKIASILWRLSAPKSVHSLQAGWYGNDTTWRMVMDLNQIVYYGTKEGHLADRRQRQFFSLCDGIIGGQGDGPLKPEPLPLGIVSFSNTSAWNDVVLAQLMGIDVEKLPLLASAKRFEKQAKVSFLLNQSSAQLTDYEKISIKAKMPPGWIDYNKI